MQNGKAKISEDSLAFSSNANILLPYNPVIALLSIYPKDLKMYVYTKSYIRMFIAALFTIAKTKEQPRCS